MILLMASAFACTPLRDATEHLTTALLNGLNLAGPRQEITESLSCAPADKQAIAAWFLAEGAALHTEGHPADAVRWLAAARRLAPEAWDVRFGREVYAVWATAVSAGPASLRVDIAGTLDGTPVETWPQRLDAGPHVLQVVGYKKNVRSGGVVELEADEDAFLPTNLAPEPKPTFFERRPPTMLFAAGGAALLAGAAAGLAARESVEMEGIRANLSATEADLDASHSRQEAFAYSTWVLAGLSVTSVGIYFVIPEKY